jgi:hypothetical protein
MVEGQQNPFRLARGPCALFTGRCIARTVQFMCGTFHLAIASRILFVFFNGRVFSTEYDLTPTSDARLI